MITIEPPRMESIPDGKNITENLKLILLGESVKTLLRNELVLPHVFKVVLAEESRAVKPQLFEALFREVIAGDKTVAKAHDFVAVYRG